jgi:hypothetical protein
LATVAELFQFLEQGLPALNQAWDGAYPGLEPVFRAAQNNHLRNM